MENGRFMILHATLIGILLFGVMKFGLGQSTAVAEDRSILLACLVLIYMILFGHSMPNFGKINTNIFGNLFK